MSATGYYLLDHQNPNAPVRADGRRYWGYPTRSTTPVAQLVGHSTEGIPDYTPPDHGAENTASYFTHSTVPASYHTVVDSDTIVPLLPFTSTAFHVARSGWNSRTVGISVSTRAAQWGTDPDWDLRAISNFARATAEGLDWLAAVTGHAGGPKALVRILTPGEAITLQPGMCQHGDLQADRTDWCTNHRLKPDLVAAWADFTLDALRGQHPPEDIVTPEDIEAIGDHVVAQITPIIDAKVNAAMRTYVGDGKRPVQAPIGEIARGMDATGKFDPKKEGRSHTTRLLHRDIEG